MAGTFGKTISELEEIQEINNGDLLLLETAGGTKSVDIQTLKELILQDAGYAGGGASGPSYEIVSFADGTDEQLAAMLETHYKGDINIADYWNVGDTRLVHLNAMAKSTGSSITHAAQDMTMVIIGINHDDLVTMVNGKSKAAVTIQCRELLGNNGTSENEYFWGSSYMPVPDNINYASTPMRTWLNDVFINSMPGQFQSSAKAVVKKCFCTHTFSDYNTITANDKAFLLAIPEIYGTTDFPWSKNGGYEGSQYPYYATDSNRIKYINNNGTKGSAGSWWMRTPSAAYYTIDSTGFFWAVVNNSGDVTENQGNVQLGLCPAFCM